MLAIPRSLVPGVLALVHSTKGHPGVARTTMMLREIFFWPTLGKDAREYDLSCGCRRRMRAHSRQVAMLPARFLLPWDVLELYIHDMKYKSVQGNKFMLPVADRAFKLVFAFPLPSKVSQQLASKSPKFVLDVWGTPRHP